MHYDYITLKTRLVIRYMNIYYRIIKLDIILVNSAG